MTNELTKFLNADNLPAVDGGELANALAEAADDATTGAGGNRDYLTFSGKTGQYRLGREGADIDPDQLYLVEPRTFIGGWVCWKDSKRVDQIEWSVYKAAEQAVDVDDLEDHGPYRKNSGEGWRKMLGLGLISCDAMKSQLKFSSNSKSGRNSIGDLMKSIAARAVAEEPSLPLIYFDSVTFEAQGAQNYKPVLQIDTWVTRDSASAYIGGSLSKEQLLAGKRPKKKRARKNK